MSNLASVFSDEETPTPVQTISYIDSYFQSLHQVYSRFYPFFEIDFEELFQNYPLVFKELHFLSILNQGEISVLAIPPNVSLLGELFNFFEQMKIDVRINFPNYLPKPARNRLDELVRTSTTKARWLSFRNCASLSNWEDLEFVPNLVQQDLNLAETCFFFAERIYRSRRKTVSSDAVSPAYVRTSDVIGGYRVFVAFVEERQLIISAFPEFVIAFTPFAIPLPQEE